MRRCATDLIADQDVFSPTTVSHLPLDPLVISNARTQAELFGSALLAHYQKLPHPRLPASTESHQTPHLLPHVRYHLGVVGTLPPASTATATPSLGGVSSQTSPHIQFIAPPASLSAARPVAHAANPLAQLVNRVCGCVRRIFGACIYEVARALHVPRRHRCRLESDASAHSSLSPSDARCEFYYCRRATTTTTTTQHTETTTLFRKPLRPGRRTSSRSPSLLDIARFRENPLYSSADLAAAKRKAKTARLQQQSSTGSCASASASASCGFMVSSKEMGARRARHTRLGVASGTIRCASRSAAADSIRPQDSLSDEADEAEAHTMVTSVVSSLEGAAAATAAALIQLRREERLRRLSQDLDSSSGSNVLYEQTAPLDAILASTSPAMPNSQLIVKSYSLMAADLNNNSSSIREMHPKLFRPTSTIEHSRVELEPVGNSVNHKVKERNEMSKTRLESHGDAVGNKQCGDAQLAAEASTASLRSIPSDPSSLAPTEAAAAAATTAAADLVAAASTAQSNVARGAIQPTFSFSYEYSSEQSDKQSDVEADTDADADADADVDPDANAVEPEQQPEATAPEGSAGERVAVAGPTNGPLSLKATTDMMATLRPLFSESSSSPNTTVQSSLPAASVLSPMPLATQCELGNMAAYGHHKRVPVQLAPSQSLQYSMADSFQLALPSPYALYQGVGVGVCGPNTPFAAAAVLGANGNNSNCAFQQLQQLQMGAAPQQCFGPQTLPPPPPAAQPQSPPPVQLPPPAYLFPDTPFGPNPSTVAGPSAGGALPQAALQHKPQLQAPASSFPAGDCGGAIHTANRVQVALPAAASGAVDGGHLQPNRLGNFPPNAATAHIIQVFFAQIFASHSRTYSCMYWNNK